MGAYDCSSGIPHQIDQLVRQCHMGQYNAFKYTALAFSVLGLLLAIANFALIVRNTGVKNLNQNVRTTTHWVVALHLIIGTKLD